MSTTSDVVAVAVPDIGDFADVPIIEIHVSLGDQVAVEDPLVTLESDKATMDVPAPFAGTVRELLVNIGDTVSEGVKLLTLAPAGDSVENASQAGEQAAPSTPAPAEAAAAPASEGNGGGPVYASPAVRRIARELGVDLHQVTGSGRKGRIVKEDVQAFADRGPSAPAPPTPAAGGVGLGLDLPAWPSVDFSKFGEADSADLGSGARA
jgi:pyruvate dehydrogenase E2 component (dihydrolipoyllysine-residue acetyltransferase)